VRLPCDHCFHKVKHKPLFLSTSNQCRLIFEESHLCFFSAPLPQHCMVAWLRKKAECPTCRASVWPVQGTRIRFQLQPRAAATASEGEASVQPQSLSPSTITMDRALHSSNHQVAAAAPASLVSEQHSPAFAAAPLSHLSTLPPLASAPVTSSPCADATSLASTAQLCSGAPSSSEARGPQQYPGSVFLDCRPPTSDVRHSTNAVHLSASLAFETCAAAAASSASSSSSRATNCAPLPDEEGWTTVSRRRRHISQ
jgi:hypothetical protein